MSPKEQPDRFDPNLHDRNELSRANAELRRSNSDMDQFAYVASHDLQEPLRMITGYLQLLQRRYRGRLDAEAEEFIQFAVDGAARMKELIEDLLRFARTRIERTSFCIVSADLIFQNALANLGAAIEDSHAEITVDSLPSICADPSLLTQVFQNLVANSIKFGKDVHPMIHVSAARHGDEWIFAIRDNGIGIEPQYAERVFQLFERLHGSEEYPGTGVGLAISKKIVERHQGRIWFSSTPGEGSTFYFSIPVEGTEVDVVQNHAGELDGSRQQSAERNILRPALPRMQRWPGA
jgi:light-regulated signal transduction histidine kinase (bacteriophytochrome)